MRTLGKLLKGVEDLHTYVERNREFVPNYGERYRNGEKIASGFVEPAINQVVSKRMVKKQQMGWSQRGAHLLLQIRTRVLDEEWEDTFRRWHPDFRPQGQGQESGVIPRNLPLSPLRGPLTKRKKIVRLGPSKDHSTKRKRSRTRLQLVSRQNGYWKINCFVMEVKRSF